MILTCPECSTSYFVADEQIGDGRMVKCASCGSSWRAKPALPLELAVSPEEGAVARQTHDADADLFERPTSELPAAELPKMFRARTEAERRLREAATQGVIWAGMGAAVALLLIGGAVFRTDVVQVWPKSASAYAAVGLPVNRVGLTIEDVHAQPALQDGKPALVISGVLRNIRARTVTAPSLSIALLDKGGKRVLTKTASPGDPIVPAGQTRTFAINVVNPPSSASDLEVTFVVDRPALAPKPVMTRDLQIAPAASAAPQAMLLGPTAPENAKPLPATDPYALKGGPGGQ